jgi:arginine/lysine/ornithine decarboxylase
MSSDQSLTPPSPDQPSSGLPSHAPRPSLSVYYNASRLRTDSWNRLKTAARHLAEATRSAAPKKEHRRLAAETLAALKPLEAYWAFPGQELVDDLAAMLEDKKHEDLAWLTARVVRSLTSHTYRARVMQAGTYALTAGISGRQDRPQHADEEDEVSAVGRPYFEVLVVDQLTQREEAELHAQLLAHRRPEDEFFYNVVVTPSFEDALIATMLNFHIQSVVIRYGFPFASSNHLSFVKRVLGEVDVQAFERLDDAQVGLLVGRTIQALRPTLDLFLVTDAPVEELAGNLERRFRRVFFRQEDYLELHQSILKGIRTRFRTPFFSALRSYAQKPTGVFHALPISRAKSISKSHWIRDMEQFYGTNVFMAETSATTAGLDSLLQPHGSLKEAQELAARAFGAKRSFFVTNGTSTANKIVLQSLTRPGDLVLVTRDCHMSHHYALMLAGALPVYMDPYPLTPYSIYGGVPLREIKRHLLDLRRQGKLARVRLLLLTNCTFDGIVYNPQRVMEEVLAIKPDMIFVWDEAWWAFAYFNPITRQRTAMEAARQVRELLRSPEYAATYATWRAGFEVRCAEEGDAAWLDERLLADPAARVRVYATQSTHKTLTSLRQGSMIHVHDQDFERTVQHAFHEAYLTHTSSSANYQILASLDVGRRQVELEGYELVQHATELALTLRERINSHPLISRYFRLLSPEDLVPAEFRPSGFQTYRDIKTSWSRLDRAWEEDEFCLEPTRLTLFVANLGVTGDTFKRRLIEQFDIQVNKTSRNTVLFMTHIGTTRGAVAYLIEVLMQVAAECEERAEDEGALSTALQITAVEDLTGRLPPLPNFSAFHEAFRPDPEAREGHLRLAFFEAAAEESVEHLKLDGSIERALAAGRQVVSAAYIIPYPPGFPLLVPGQILSQEILAFLKAQDVKEIHGYEPAWGLRVFREETLARIASQRVDPAPTSAGQPPQLALVSPPDPAHSPAPAPEAQ